MGSLCSKKKVDNDSGIKESLMKSDSTVYSENKYKNYFSLIEENLNKFYDENRDNQVNLSISLDKKDFNSNFQSKRLVLNHKQKFIYWKDYLMSYLYRVCNHGYEWSHEMIMLINNELFLSENRWLSMFFWQEFELRIKPKSLLNILKNKAENQRDSNLCERLNYSFCSVNTDSLSLNDPTHEYKEYRQKVKAYISIFKEHIFDSEHPINIIVNHFAKVFSQYISEKLTQIKSLVNITHKEYDTKLNDLSQEITKLLQKMILKLQTTIRLMYCRTINYQYFIEERDELINLITSLVISNSNLYYALIKLYKVCHEDEVNIFKKKLKSLKNIRPQDLGINEKFCLNDITLAYQKRLLQEEDNNVSENIYQNSENPFNKKEILKQIDYKLSSPSNKDPYIPDSFGESFPASSATMKLNIKESRSEEQIENQTSLNDKLDICKKDSNDIKVYYGGKKDLKLPVKVKNKNSYSYERAIKTLKLLNSYKIPYEKMAVIASISNEITDCVNDFWKDMEKIITTSLLNIDADELMSIFIYIIIKAQMPSLIVHMKMIKEFTTCITKTTMMGYYFVTLDASIIYILELDEKNIKINKDKLRNSLMNNRSYNDCEEGVDGITNKSKKFNFN